MDEDRTVAGQIAHELAQRIVSGEIPPATRLRQDWVAEQFRVSQGPVREAFRRLEAQGLLVSEPRRGVRVAGLDVASIYEVIQMRAALEALALRHAIPNIDAQTLAFARRALADAEGSNDIWVWEAANRHFHRVLLAPCGMPRLLATIDDLLSANARFLFATWRNLDWQPPSGKEHRELLEAIEAKQAERAVTALIRYIIAGGEALMAATRQQHQKQPPQADGPFRDGPPDARE